MANLQKKPVKWYENLNKVRGYNYKAPKWPLYAAAACFLASIVLIITATVVNCN